MLQARRYWPHIAAFLVVSLLSTPLTLLIPVPLRLVVDSVLGSRPIPPVIAAIVPQFTSTAGKLLAVAAILNVAVVLLIYLQGLTTWLLQTYVGERVSIDFKARLFRHKRDARPCFLVKVIRPLNLELQQSDGALIEFVAHDVLFGNMEALQIL